MKNPIFLLGSHKSGSTLLRSLFDGHPDLFVIPIELHFFQFSGYWVDYRMRREFPRALSKEERVERMVAHIEMSNRVVDPKSDNFSQHCWSIEEFKSSMGKADPKSESDWFEAYVMAVHRALYGTDLPPEKRIVEKTVENAEFACELRSMYPDCKFIHIVRNPYSTLVAIRKSRAVNRYPYLGSLLRSLHNSFYFLYKNSRLLKNYFILRYEELVANPDKWVSEMAGFLDLEVNESLTKPTYMGEDWSGNSSAEQKFSGISTDRVDAWKSEIYPVEIALINKYLSHVLADHGYEQIEPSKSVWWPMPKENLKHYLANRTIYM